MLRDGWKALAGSFVIGLAMMVLTACSSAVTFRTRCPQLIEYPKPLQEQAGNEYHKLRENGEAAVVRRLIDDYGELRAQCRALNKED